MPKTNESFKEKYQNLEKIVEQLSDQEQDIDEAIILFKEGIKLYKECQKSLTVAQEEVIKLLAENGEELEYK